MSKKVVVKAVQPVAEAADVIGYHKGVGTTINGLKTLYGSRKQ